MPATDTDLTIEQGADWSHGWAVRYLGQAIDETWTARSQVRATTASPDVLHEFDAQVDADGNVLLSVTAAESSAWGVDTWTLGRYDVEVESPDGFVGRVAEGYVTVSPEVTR